MRIERLSRLHWLQMYFLDHILNMHLHRYRFFQSDILHISFAPPSSLLQGHIRYTRQNLPSILYVIHNLNKSLHCNLKIH